MIKQWIERVLTPSIAIKEHELACEIDDLKQTVRDLTLLNASDQQKDVSGSCRGWINIIFDGLGNLITEGDIYSSEDDAKGARIYIGRGYVATVKIEW